MIFVVGCGDNLKGEAGGSDGGGGGDGGADAFPLQCDAPATGAPGSACSDDTECDSAAGAADGRCLRGEKRNLVFPDSGYCVRMCAGDATDCGEGTVCIAQADFPNDLCVAACCEGVACAAGYACSTAIAGEEIAGAACLPGDEAAADGTPCGSIAECDGNSECEPDQSGTSGQCSTSGCTVDDDSTCAPGGDGHCVDEDAGDDLPPHCVDPCDTSDDCAGDDGQRCDQADMICRHSVIGDPCEADGECGQTPWDCKTEADDEYPGGYCTIPCGDGCPAGSVCNDDVLGGGEDAHCVESCTLIDGCPREGYDCVDVSSSALLRGCVPTPI
jgi:hypothetical protein